jgi:hypothetical protein
MPAIIAIPGKPQSRIEFLSRDGQLMPFGLTAVFEIKLPSPEYY